MQNDMVSIPRWVAEEAYDALESLAFDSRKVVRAVLDGPSPAPSGTVRVRAAVAVCRDGSWAVSGSSRHGDEVARDIAADCLDPDAPPECITHFISADVPLPVAVEIEARVEEAK